MINGIQVGIYDADLDREIEHHVVAPLRVRDADHFKVDAEDVFQRRLARILTEKGLKKLIKGSISPWPDNLVHR